jgi:hypothetical protein
MCRRADGTPIVFATFRSLSHPWSGIGQTLLLIA